VEATNRSAFVKCGHDDFKLQNWALTDGFSNISSELLKNKNDFKILPLNQNVTFFPSLKHPLFADLFSVTPPPPSLSLFCVRANVPSVYTA
jgi:hypothetical protein